MPVARRRGERAPGISSCWLLRLREDGNGVATARAASENGARFRGGTRREKAGVMSSPSRRSGAHFAYVVPWLFIIAPACGGVSDLSPSAEPSSAVHDPRAPLGLAGSPCSGDSQCASERCSVSGYGSAACGECLVARNVGEPCGAAGVTCGRTASCRDGVCVSSRAWIGASCTVNTKGGSTDCDEELGCKVVDGRGEGTCVRRPRLGEPCEDSAVRCKDSVCHDGACIADGPRELGESCAGSYCGEGLFCRRSDQTCRRAELPEGARCDDLFGAADCKPGTHCQVAGESTRAPYTMRCFAPVGLGESCDGRECSRGMFCEAPEAKSSRRICQSRRGVSSPCRGTNECLDGLECRAEQCLRACRAPTPQR